MENSNPYATPITEPQATLSDTPAEAVRRAHIKHEASIKTLAVLHLLGGLGMIVSLLTFLSGSHEMILAIPFLLVGVLDFFLFSGLRKFRPWARWTSLVIVLLASLLTLMARAFPVLLINGFLVFILVSAKSTMIFSPAYKEIIAATPHIRYKSPLWLWILLGVLLLILVLIFVSFVR